MSGMAPDEFCFAALSSAPDLLHLLLAFSKRLLSARLFFFFLLFFFALKLSGVCLCNCVCVCVFVCEEEVRGSVKTRRSSKPQLSSAQLTHHHMATAVDLQMRFGKLRSSSHPPPERAQSSAAQPRTHRRRRRDSRRSSRILSSSPWALAGLARTRWTRACSSCL